jgi:phage terminase small subunit
MSSAELILASEQPAPERTVAVVAAAGQRLKNPRHERFARYALEHTLADAWRRAMGKGLRAKPASVWQAASALAARPEVARRIAELRAVAARGTALDLAAYAQELRDITLGDVTEIQYRGACRFCFSADGVSYQWRDATEFGDAVVKAYQDGATLPSDAGGYGYDGSLHPSPACKRCDGAGDHLFTADVTRLSPKARALFKGFGKNGEALIHDKLQARAQLSKILGLDRDDTSSVARAAAAGAAAGAALGVTVAEALTPDQRMTAYLKMIRGD